MDSQSLEDKIEAWRFEEHAENIQRVHGGSTLSVPEQSPSVTYRLTVFISDSSNPELLDLSTWAAAKFA